MISLNGLCLKNIWTGTKALSQSPRCSIYRTSDDQMSPVQTVAPHSLASACILVSVLVSLAPRDAKVPVDRRAPLGFLWFKMLVALAVGAMDKTRYCRRPVKNQPKWQRVGGLVFFWSKKSRAQKEEGGGHRHLGPRGVRP